MNDQVTRYAPCQVGSSVKVVGWITVRDFDNFCHNRVLLLLVVIIIIGAIDAERHPSLSEVARVSLLMLCRLVLHDIDVVVVAGGYPTTPARSTSADDDRHDITVLI